MNPRKLNRFEWVGKVCEAPVLDVGCGDAPYKTLIHDHGYVGMDIDKESDDMQADRPQNFILGDGNNIPFEDNSFNTVILAEVLEHLDNPVRVIMEARRVAYGKLVITVPDEARWLDEADPNEHEDHKRTYNGSKLKDQIVVSGFNHEDIKLDHLNNMPFAFWLAQCYL